MMLNPATLNALLLAIGLAACSSIENDFIITDSGNAVSSADVVLCGARIPLVRHGNVLSGSFKITCEGEGFVSANLRSGGEIRCRIGYVTPGAKQDFNFVVERGQCLAA